MAIANAYHQSVVLRLGKYKFLFLFFFCFCFFVFKFSIVHALLFGCFDWNWNRLCFKPTQAEPSHKIWIFHACVHVCDGDHVHRVHRTTVSHFRKYFPTVWSLFNRIKWWRINHVIMLHSHKSIQFNGTLHLYFLFVFLSFAPTQNFKTEKQKNKTYFYYLQLAIIVAHISCIAQCTW